MSARRPSALFLLAACLPLACAAPEPHFDLLLTNASVVDVERGTVTPGRALAIAGGRIARVVAVGEATGHAARVEDLRGAFVIPGLWDMHVHALWDDEVADAFLPAFTRAGVTGVRDMGGSLEVLARVRATPDPSWPRIVAAGLVLDGPQPIDPSISLAVSGAADARRAVAQLAAAGADFVKPYTLLPRDGFFAAARAAAAAGLPLAGHVPAEVTPLEAAEAGLASLEHLRDELGGLCSAAEGEECADLAARLAALGTHVTPTLAILEAKTIPGYAAPGSEPDLDALPPAVSAYWREARASQRERGDDYFAAKRASFEQRLDTLRRLHAAGVPILAGSDTGNPFVLPGAGLHRELELLVAAGLTPREALYAATLGAARFLGHADSGAVEAGMAADLVVLAADPLEDVAQVRQVVAVVRGGRLWLAE